MTYRCPAVPDPAGIPWATRPVTLKLEILGKDAKHMTKSEMMKAVLENAHKTTTFMEQAIEDTSVEMSDFMMGKAIEALEELHTSARDILDLTHGMAREMGVQL